jgi:hypothetical protein
MSRDSTADSFEGLIDVISEVPQLLEESQTVLSGPNNSFSNQEPILIASLLRIFQKLDGWHQSCVTSSSKPPYWAVHSKAENPSDYAFGNKLFPFVLEFESLDVATQLILNSAVMLQILWMILRVVTKYSTSDSESLLNQALEIMTRDFKEDEMPISTELRAFSVPSIQSEADKAARFVCQSIEYCYQIRMGTVGPQSTSYSQGLLRGYFRQARFERELEWCRNIKQMSGPTYRCGINLMIIGVDESDM